MIEALVLLALVPFALVGLIMITVCVWVGVMMVDDLVARARDR